MMLYVGWIRQAPGGRWRIACTAATWETAWDALIPIRPAHWNSIEKTVLPEGRHPNDAGVRKR